MGLFSWLAGRGQGEFKKAVEAVLRAAGDDRALLWGDELEALLVDRWPEDGESLPLEAVFRLWSKSGDDALLSRALASKARAGAKTERGRYCWLCGASGLYQTLLDGGTPAVKPVVPGLSGVLICVDGPKSGGVLTAAELARVGLTAEQAWSETLASAPLGPFLPLTDRMWVAPLTVVLAWERQNPPTVFGEQLLVLLGRDRAIYAGTEDQESVEGIAELIRLFLAEGAPLLGHSLVRRGDRWERWLPPREQRAARLFFVMMRRCSLRDEYAAQAKYLSRTRPEFVATYRAETEDGITPTSASAWGEGITTLLPRSDYLGVGRLMGKVRLVRFPTALEKLGRHLKPVEGLWPPRWLVDSFPTADELAGLPEGPEPVDPGEWFEDDAGATAVEVTPALAQMGQADFACEALQVLAELGFGTARYAEEQFALLLELGPELRPADAPSDMEALFRIGLETPYGRFGHLPAEQRRASTREYLGEVLRSLRTPSAPEPRQLMPLLRPDWAFWHWSLQLKLMAPGYSMPPDPQIQRAFTNALRIGFVIDSGMSVQPIRQSELTRLGFSADRLFEVAMENLASASARALERVAAGVYCSPYLDDYDATRVLLPHLLDGLELQGAPVAFVPNRSTLVITGAESPAGVAEAFARTMLAQKSDSRVVHRLPLTLCEQRWVPWLPPSSHVARPMLERLAEEQLMGELQVGRELVSKLWPKSRVADIATKRDEGGGLCPRLAAVLREIEAPVLLPTSDVVLMPDGRELDWSEFQRAYPRALTPAEGTRGHWWHFDLSERVAPAPEA